MQAQNIFKYKIIALTSLVVSAAVVSGIYSGKRPAAPDLAGKSSASTPDISDLSFSSNEPLEPIPAQKQLDQQLVALGKKLFQDKRLSADNSVACSSCHDLARGGADRLQRSKGIHGAEGSVNTPTVYNSDLNFVQFWDGRAAGLEEQIAGPITNPKEMGSSFDEIAKKLGNDQGYKTALSGLDAAGLTPKLIAGAIAEFERSLRTPDSPFDRFLMGDASAISTGARRGYGLFKAYGCVACHQGRGVGGNMFQKLGIMGDYFSDRGNVTEADQGRFNVTHDENDRNVFKVPSLRNVEFTAPYFHDGSAATLEDAVHKMAKYQLGRSLSPEDTDSLVAFLHSLSGPVTK